MVLSASIIDPIILQMGVFKEPYRKNFLLTNRVDCKIKIELNLIIYVTTDTMKKRVNTLLRYSSSETKYRLCCVNPVRVLIVKVIRYKRDSNSWRVAVCLCIDL